MRCPEAAQPASREDRAGLGGKSERPILPEKPGNAGGGKGPWFKGDAGRSKGTEIGVSLTTLEMSGSFRRHGMPKRRANRSCAKA